MAAITHRCQVRSVRSMRIVPAHAAIAQAGGQKLPEPNHHWKNGAAANAPATANDASGRRHSVQSSTNSAAAIVRKGSHHFSA